MSKGTILYIGFFKLPDKNAAAQRVMGNAKIFRDLGYNVVFLDEQDDIEYRDLLDTKHYINDFEVYSQKRPKNFKTFLSKMLNIYNIDKIISEISDLKMVITYNYPSIALNKLRKKYQYNFKIILKFFSQFI